MRLDKFLCDALGETRSDVKKLLRKKLISVDGVTITDGGYKLSDDSCVTYQGRELINEEFIYYIFHKPAGCVTAREDHLHKTVMDYIPDNRKHDLSPVGRLDLDTEGLLLITNDGELAHILLSPRSEIEKEYLAHVDGPVTESDVEAFASGLDIHDEKRALPAKLQIISSEEEESICLVRVMEGRFHEVKRLFLARGRKVTYLKRLSMGRFLLDDDLKPGEYRRLTEEEMNYVREYKGSAI